MNQAMITNLTNTELADILQNKQDVSALLLNELAARFIKLVEDGIISNTNSSEDIESELSESRSEIDDLRSAIEDALDILKHV